LGVKPSATSAEIKQAYREQAKKFHPDVNNGADIGGRFKAISEAYTVLSDANRRAAYDRAGFAHARPGGPRSLLQPLRCSRCRQITAQPRYLVFRHVVSLILVTQATPIQGIFCSTCAGAAALRASAVSAAFGWWGVPFGPIYTVFYTFMNAFGGARDEANEERLLLHNAFAFAQRGNLKLAHGLAILLRSANNRDIQAAAADLSGQLILRDPSLSEAAIKSAWTFRPLHLLAHLAMLAAVPAMVIAILYGTGFPGTSSRGPYATSPAIDGGTNYYGPTESGPSTPTAAVPLPSRPEPTCAHPPANGRRLGGYLRERGDGHSLVIENGAEGPAIIKVRNAATGRLAVSFFVAAGNTASFDRLPDGDYRIQYAIGGDLRRDCRSFVSPISIAEFPRGEPFVTQRQEEYDGVRIIRSRLTYTLYTTPGGTILPVPIDPGSFERN
jgi:hypothetical protein